MAYDETLALRIKAELQTRAAIAERKMFGGLAFMIGGTMYCCVTDTARRTRRIYVHSAHPIAPSMGSATTL